MTAPVSDLQVFEVLTQEKVRDPALYEVLFAAAELVEQFPAEAGLRSDAAPHVAVWLRASATTALVEGWERRDQDAAPLVTAAVAFADLILREKP